MSDNDLTLPEREHRPSVTVSKREEIFRNADKILADMNLRKDVVGSLLTHKELQPNWAKVRENCLNFSKTGHLLANPVVSKLFEEAEPLLNQFQVQQHSKKALQFVHKKSPLGLANNIFASFIKCSA
jgi:hypothetical protein